MSTRKLILACLLAGIVGCDSTPSLPDAEWQSLDLMSQAKSVTYREQFLLVLAKQAELPREVGLADSLAHQLASGSSYREFSKHRRDRFTPDGHDRIILAKATGGRVTFTYRRNGERIGLQTGFVNRIGGDILFSGRWFQQSKMDGAGRGQVRHHNDFTPRDDSASAWRRLRYIDEGVFIYYGTLVDGNLDLPDGWDLNLRDQIRGHESWLRLARHK